MDNDELINQARHLYAVLCVEQYKQSLENKAGLDRLDRTILRAYCRYQRRLNRCVVCYQSRLCDCIRELTNKKCRLYPAENDHSMDLN